MQKVDKHTKQKGKELCKVCGSELVNGVCSTCGWVQIIFPSDVPSEIADFEVRREEMAKRIYKDSCDSKAALIKLEKAHNSECSKSEMYQQKFEEVKKEAKCAQSECERCKKQIDDANNGLTTLKIQNQKLATNVQHLSAQNQSLLKEKESVLIELERIKKNPPVSSDAQIRIAENNGRYILYDVSGIVHRSNGNSIGKSGIELYDGYIFHIGELSFKVKAPEINIDNLIL